MIHAATIILALYLEPVGSVLEEPWDYLAPIEMIDVIEIEELERKLFEQDIRTRFLRVGEVVGQTFHRCELTATPCRPAITEGSVP